MIHVFIYFFEYLFKSFVSKVLYGSLSMENFGINREPAHKRKASTKRLKVKI